MLWNDLMKTLIENSFLSEAKLILSHISAIAMPLENIFRNPN